MTRRRKSKGPLEDAISALLYELDPEIDLKAYSVFAVWNECVGQAIAVNAQPTKFSRGMLTVTVMNSVWNNQLSMMKGEVKKKLNKALAGQLVKDIRFVVGPVPKVNFNEAKEPDANRRELSKDELQEIERLVSEVEDKALKETLRQFLVIMAGKQGLSGDKVDE